MGYFLMESGYAFDEWLTVFNTGCFSEDDVFQISCWHVGEAVHVVIAGSPDAEPPVTRF